MTKTVVCFGPGPMFKGGISNYNTSLAKALDKIPDTKVHIVSWTQQYPAIVPREFVDKSSKADLLEGTQVDVTYLTNYNNPSSWIKTAKLIKSLNADKVIIQWSIAIQGLPVGRIINWLKRHTKTEVVVDLHFVLQKEKSKIDRFFLSIGIGNAHTYLVHSLKTFEELKAFYPKKSFQLVYDGVRSDDQNIQTVVKLYHPIYDLFQPDEAFDIQAFKDEHGLKKNVFLFFGFIRKYKGLHQAIEAFAKMAKDRDDVSLLICGESFWNTLDSSKWSTKLKTALFGTAKKLFLSKSDDERQYQPLALIKSLGIESKCVVFNTFIPNEDVHKYFQASDCVVLYYLTATPSGIESLSYNFNLPILATDVGHFPETIKDGYNGYLAKGEDIGSMADVMEKFISAPLPRENVSEIAKDLSWENYAQAILK
ncbi:MAG: glycosyltransferase [Bacteroidetes bacterium]|jgi:glycosyltransferase involved in cell wall biosynthesis|nr:glycosyltransferase [Bacteroidota bacterium]